MSSINLIALLVYNLIPICGVLYYWRFKKSNPVFWFFVFHSIIASGTIVLMDFGAIGDVVYYVIFVLSILFFFFGSYVSFSVHDTKKFYRKYFQKPIHIDSKRTIFVMGLLLIFSAAITLLYYYLLGYNLFANIILGTVVEDFSSARLEAYSGSKYLAPGYVNQFKNVIFPITFSAILVYYLKKNQKRKAYLLLFFILPVLILGLLGTGQRAFLVYAFLAFLFGYLLIDNISTTSYTISVISVFTLFGISSFYLGRISNLDYLSAITQVFERAFITEQYDSLIGFRYMYGKGVVWFSEWIDSIAGILPNNPGSNLQNEIFFVLHGTFRGTGAFSTVGSVYYNSSIIGVIFFYFFMGYIYNYIYVRFMKGRKTIVRSILYGSLFFYLSSFVSGDLMSLLNRGFATILIMMFIRKVKLNYKS